MLRKVPDYADKIGYRMPDRPQCAVHKSLSPQFLWGRKLLSIIVKKTTMIPSGNKAAGITEWI